MWFSILYQVIISASFDCGVLVDIDTMDEGRVANLSMYLQSIIGRIILQIA